MDIVNTGKEKNVICSIQQTLKNCNLYTGKIDGLFGTGSIEGFRLLLGGSIPVRNPGSYLYKDVITVLQEALVKAGYDTGGVDGIWGSNSEKSLSAVLIRYRSMHNSAKPVEDKPVTGGKFVFSKASEDNLKGVKPQLVKVIRRALELTDVDFGVREGLRSVEQQRLNVAKGVSQTMNSKHLTGDAVDLYPSVLPEGWQTHPEVWVPLMKVVKKAGDELGVKLRFGINWKNDPSLPIETKFPDAPHVELV